MYRREKVSEQKKTEHEKRDFPVRKFLLLFALSRTNIATIVLRALISGRVPSPTTRKNNETMISFFVHFPAFHSGLTLHSIL